MLIVRSWHDYLALRFRVNARLLISLMLLVVNASVRLSSTAFSLAPVVYWTLQFIAIAALLVSVALWMRDLRRANSGRYDVIISEDPKFVERALALRAAPPAEIVLCGESPLWQNREIDTSLDETQTPLEVDEGSYHLPPRLYTFLTASVSRLHPSTNDLKVRLMSDLSPYSMQGGVRIQKTTYFYGVATNEIATCAFTMADWEHNRDDIIFSVYDQYVNDGGALVALSDSALSNHIGVTSLVITADSCVVLQKQGTTLVDKGKFTVGASGSADWRDVKLAFVGGDRSDDGSRTLQQLVRYAMEREISEEIGATVGAGNAKTTLTGFARYVHRGGKPEFFGLTFLRQRYDELPREIRPSERKWVRQKLRRQASGNDATALISTINEIESEFKEAQSGSVSLFKAIDCARFYLALRARPIEELRP